MLWLGGYSVICLLGSLYAFMSCSVSSMYKRICIHYVILQRDYFSLEGMTESIVF